MSIKKVYIPIVGINNHHRGLGIGSKLFELTIEYIREESLESISLEIWGGSLSQFFYQKHGFEEVEK